MCYFDFILLSDVISSIGPKISDADTFVSSQGHIFDLTKTVPIVFFIVLGPTAQRQTEFEGSASM